MVELFVQGLHRQLELLGLCMEGLFLQFLFLELLSQLDDLLLKVLSFFLELVSELFKLLINPDSDGLFPVIFQVFDFL